MIGLVRVPYVDGIPDCCGGFGDVFGACRCLDCLFDFAVDLVLDGVCRLDCGVESVACVIDTVLLASHLACLVNFVFHLKSNNLHAYAQ